jgi:serine/threonine protein kinase
MGQGASNVKRCGGYPLAKKGSIGDKANAGGEKIGGVLRPKKYSSDKNVLKNVLPKIDNKKNLRENNCTAQKSKFAKSSEGKSVDDYVFLKVIGRGNFGKVVLVKSKDDNNFYALKCMKKSNIAELKCETLIKTEKRTLEKIDHPFIIKLHLTFQTPDKLFLLLDYCNGGELFFHLQKKIRFSEELSKFYAAQLYLAISYLHFNNIIFRDLKPENVILDNMGYLKLIDFGLCKDKFYTDSLTATICGTPEYLGKPFYLINSTRDNKRREVWFLSRLVGIWDHTP